MQVPLLTLEKNISQLKHDQRKCGDGGGGGWEGGGLEGSIQRRGMQNLTGKFFKNRTFFLFLLLSLPFPFSSSSFFSSSGGKLLRATVRYPSGTTESHDPGTANH